MTLSNPLVSIVTPCFNSAQFIESCIESVLAQDYPRVEHIIQDGGSTDGTLEILHRYDGKVDWVSEPDKGQADGLDRALKRSHGDIILVLNADDMLLPHAARWGVDNMAKFPEASVVYGDEYIIDEHDEVIGRCYGPEPYDFQKLLCVEQVPPAQAAFIRRTHFEQVGLGTDPDLDTCPDYEMWVRIVLKFPMVHVPGFVSNYRWHRLSGSRRSAMVKRFVKAKRQVMDRVFNSPAVSDDIRALRRRAYASLDLWAPMWQFTTEGSWGIKTLLHMTRGLLRYPSRYNCNRFIGQVIGLVMHWKKFRLTY